MENKMDSSTRTFHPMDEKEQEMRNAIISVFEALKEKGYNPINQIVGYILSEDPTYITNYKNARSMIRRVDREELLRMVLREFLNNNSQEEN